MNRTFHCFFEQSGTFKNEFIKLGYKSYDYDIKNDFDETNQVYCGKKTLGEPVLVNKINELTKAVNYLLEKSEGNG